MLIQFVDDSSLSFSDNNCVVKGKSHWAPFSDVPNCILSSSGAFNSSTNLL